MIPHVQILQEGRVLPSATTYNALARLLKYADCDTGNVLFSVNAQGGLRLSVPGMGSGGSAGGATAAYDGPFAVSYSPGTAGPDLTVAPGRVWAGTRKIHFPGYTTTEIFTPDSELAFFLVVWYFNDYELGLEYGSLDTYENDDERYRVPLAVLNLGGRVTQLQHGDIFIAGRCV